jgi:Zn-dependent peptidase ImmA (M78 family)/DNA-binding XRE family transcriptional regulator
MARDLKLLGTKLTRYRDQLQLSTSEVAEFTGISEKSLIKYESGNEEPSGDEILILSDFFKCDYRFFISNEQLAPFEQTETLYRLHGEHFSKQDRWAVQEFLYLSECENYLERILGKEQTRVFRFDKKGTFFKRHGRDAALSLRQYLGYKNNEVKLDIYEDFRILGLHVFRRSLENSAISGLFIKHPVAGKCVLVNHIEDIYRQRFTAAHEAGHAILDDEDDFIVSFSWDKSDLKEIRVNTFASNYLMPPSFLKAIPSPSDWPPDKIIEWANKLKVSTEALAYALSEAKLIDASTVRSIKSVKVPDHLKTDPELPNTLSPNSKERKLALLKRGLSNYYVSLCFEAYRESKISAGRMAEMLLLNDPRELERLSELYGEKLIYGD